MAAIVDFDNWLTQELTSMSIDDAEVYTGYVKGVLEDESEDLEDRKESVADILEGVLEIEDEDEKEKKVQELTEKLMLTFDKFIQEKKMIERKNDENKKKKSEAIVQEKLKALAVEAEEAAANSAKNVSKLSEEERAERQRILNSYDEVMDGEISSLPTTSKNKQAARDVMNQQKEMGRQAAAKHKQDIKKMQEREKEVKEKKKEKRKPQPKKERKR